MKRTLVVLALAVISAAGCRAMSPYQRLRLWRTCCGWVRRAARPVATRAADRRRLCVGRGCGRSPAAVMGPGCGCTMWSRWRHAQRNAVATAATGCCFDRYCGSNCGPGYHPGPYDCSPCDSPNWGATAIDIRTAMWTATNALRDGACRRMPGPVPHCACCGHGYCCERAAVRRRRAAAAPRATSNYNFNPGPPVAQTAYPYYTLRGPRDFLLDNPPSIGPY